MALPAARSFLPRRPADWAAPALLLVGLGLLGYAAVAAAGRPGGDPPDLAGLTAAAAPTDERRHGFAATFRLTNRGSRPAAVVGGSSVCRPDGCVYGSRVGRLTVPPGATADLTVTGARRGPGPFAAPVTLYIEHDGATHAVTATVEGDLLGVAGAPEGAGAV